MCLYLFYQTTKTKVMKAQFTKFPKDNNWVSGICDNVTFNAKLFDNGSIFGINKGRVSKLSICDHDGRCIVCYERGWFIKPIDSVKPYFDAVMELLENSPKRFE